MWEQLFFLAQQNPQLRYETAAKLLHKGGGNAEKFSKTQTHTTGKRKLPIEEMVPSEAGHQTKRQRLSLLSEAIMESGQSQDEIQNQVQVQILQANHQLIQMLQGEHLDKSNFASAISTACDAILQIGQNAQNEILQAALQVWSSIVSGLNRRQRVSPDREFDCESITHSMCSVVRFFLDGVRQHCIEEAERQFDAPKIARGRKKKNIKIREIFHDESSDSTSILTQIIPTLKNLQETHRELFEMIMRDILLHIGDVLALHLLESSKLNPTPNTSTPSPSLTKLFDHEVNIATSAAKMEAPYLIEILKCLTRTLDLNSDNRYKSPVAAKLQRSLLRSMMGEDEACSTSSSRSCLGEVIGCDIMEDITVQSMNESSADDWFSTQVWDLLGWDVVLREHEN